MLACGLWISIGKDDNMVNIEYLIKDDSTQFWVRLPNGKVDHYWKTCSIKKIELDILKGAYITIRNLHNIYNYDEYVYTQAYGSPGMYDYEPHLYTKNK